MIHFACDILGAVRRRLPLLTAGMVLTVAPVFATPFTITPTFDSSITSDSNAATIEALINSTIAIYEGLFINPINVTIDFTEMSQGLGQSSKTLWGVSYADMFAAYQNNAQNNNDPAAQTALAQGVVPNQGTNPVTGSSDMAMATADIRALGINCPTCVPSRTNGFDGIINLNTSITNPGSPGTTSAYELMPVVEHEIDEVLGFGSSLAQSFQANDPSMEDLFRFDSLGNRSYTTNAAAQAFFSVDGTTNLAQFDNQNDGGDWADWQSNPHPSGTNPQVQDAFATPGANPPLGVEITALEAIGYDLALPATPEPGTMALLGAGLLVFGGFGYRRRRKR